MKYITSFYIVALLITSSCSSKETNAKPTLRESNGRINQILVTIDADLWSGTSGKAIKDFALADVFGLPQKEPLFKITQIPTVAFKNLFLTQKNILYVALADKEEYTIKENVYAAPQRVITLKAPTEEGLVALINQHKEEIVAAFKAGDIKAIQDRNQANQFDKDKLKTLNNLGIDLSIPVEYRLVDDTGDFLWFRKKVLDSQTMNIIVYELPIHSEDDENGLHINSIRDTIGKKHIPGQFEGTYYITEQAYTPDTKTIELVGKKTYETRGKWEVKDAFMAGPFLNYTIVDKAKNRLIVLEGFTYAPATNKRDFMFELEAILKTVIINE